MRTSWLSRWLRVGRSRRSVKAGLCVQEPDRVERVRADYNAITLQNELSRLAPDDSLADIEYKRAERRARGVNKVWRDAIVKGMRDSISLKDLIDPLPDDPRRVFVPHKADPQHDPVVLLSALTKTQRDSH